MTTTLIAIFYKKKVGITIRWNISILTYSISNLNTLRKFGQTVTEISVLFT